MATTRGHGAEEVLLDNLPAVEAAYFRWLHPITAANGPRTSTILRHHLELGVQRAPKDAVLRVYRDSRHTDLGPAVQIVNDDMPLLVDTITSALRRLGAIITDVVHPVFEVTRDDTGTLQAITLEPAATDTLAESWIHIQLDPNTGDNVLDAIESTLPALLQDLRSVAADTPAMIAALLMAADEIDMRVFDVADTGACADLLRWLADGRFTLLGAVHFDGNPTAPRPTTPTGELGMLSAKAYAEVELPARTVRPPGPYFSSASVDLLQPGAPGLHFVTVTGTDREWMFLGTLTGTALHESILDIPLVADRAKQVIAQSGFEPNSFSGKAMLEVMQSYPRAELLRTEAAALSEVVTAVMSIDLRRQVRVFLRAQPGTAYCLVFLPRDRYTSVVRERMEKILHTEFGSEHISYSARVTEFDLAVVHFTVHRLPSGVIPDLSPTNHEHLEHAFSDACRTWNDRFAALIADAPGLTDARVTFPPGYQQEHSPQRALEDVRSLNRLARGQITTDLQPRTAIFTGVWRFTLYVAGEGVSLSRVLPVLQSLGVEVLDERPFRVSLGADHDAWIYDFGLRSVDANDPADPLPLDNPNNDVHEELRERFTSAFTAAWTGRTEIDGLNSLVLSAGLCWPQILVLRAYAKYLRQTGFHYSFAAISRVLLTYPAITSQLVALFSATFDPDITHRAEPEAITDRIHTELDAITELDADRVLRALLSVITATLRTNHYRYHRDDPRSDQFAIKLDAQRVDDLPRPRPKYEIFVYSPRVEGVHLRFGAVARGGIRWSDRLTDYRTEILGLVKAQEIKNAVIVPVGAKGGFVVKQPLSVGDRGANITEARECYRRFIAAMLDLTDSINLTTSSVIPPPRVVRRDGDDPYLVVAADKGTATFSDLANDIARQYQFWLGDAFASGGSAGYDHKAIGITARGAWESVRRHFAELGTDIDQEPFTVAGIGDMSGDVFGNGMLLSPAIRLVAAFDHRHIFLDPTPDPIESYAERTRLFHQPRSSWADYASGTISPGGGVWARTTKQIPISEASRRVLDLPEGTHTLTPPELIKAILSAPVDLLWNGGIGTYIKASGESDADVADKSNDGVRIDAGSVRARVIGEGGNLGVTSRGRIQYCENGGRCNTDAVDNAAGVNCSDHEVNIKIVVDAAVSAGELAAVDRNPLLAIMTDDVALAAVRDNINQNRQLGRSRANSANRLTSHARLITYLETYHGVDRELEALPSTAEITRRRAGDRGLTSPELATLTAHAKIALKNELLNGTLPDDPTCGGVLNDYFPPAIAARFAQIIERHPLRREITTTAIVNDVIDNTGPEFIFELRHESDMPLDAVVHAYRAATQIFDLSQLRHDIHTAATPVHTADMLELATHQLLESACRWILAARQRQLTATGYREPIQRLISMSDLWLPTRLNEHIDTCITAARAGGAPQDLATRIYQLTQAFPLLDIIDTADTLGCPAFEVAQMHFALDEHLGIHHLLNLTANARIDDHWQHLARLDVFDDLHAALRTATREVLTTTPAGAPPEDRIRQWHRMNEGKVARVRSMIDAILAVAPADVASLSVAARRVLTAADVGCGENKADQHR